MTTAAPPFVEPPRIPLFPPSWAEVFGEDDFGIFAEFTVKDVCFVWRWIPPGRFLMGSPADEAGRYDDDESPQHNVTISCGFWLGETPVTQLQWTALMKKNPSHFKGGQRPVEQVSWHDGAAFAARLNDMIPGLRAALPSEAQWEYACRAGTQGAFHVDGSKCTQPTGKDPVLDELGWFDENSSSETKEVKLKQSNAWGLYDMHGNVWEWCRDGNRAYTEDSQIDPLGSMEESASRVVRGGSWSLSAQYCRAACRNRYVPAYLWLDVGFRLSAGQEPGAAEPPGAERPSVPRRRSRG